MEFAAGIREPAVDSSNGGKALALGTCTLPRPERKSKNQDLTRGEVLGRTTDLCPRQPMECTMLEEQQLCWGTWLGLGTGQKDSSASRAAGVLPGD